MNRDQTAHWTDLGPYCLQYYISIIYKFKWSLADDSIKQRVFSAYNICCIFLVFPKTNLIMLDKTMSPDQTAPSSLLWVYTVCNNVHIKIANVCKKYLTKFILPAPE